MGRGTFREGSIFLFPGKFYSLKIVVRRSEIVVHKPELIKKTKKKRRSRVSAEFLACFSPVLGPGWGQGQGSGWVYACA